MTILAKERKNDERKNNNHKISKLIVHKDKSIEYFFKTGKVKTIHYEFKSRKESWNGEMREQARKDSLKRWLKK